MSSEDRVTKALRELHSTQNKHLNRLLACEALLQALLARVDPQALPGIAEEFEAALDRAAADVPPRFQMPDIWHQWSALLEDLRQAHESRPDRPPGAG